MIGMPIVQHEDAAGYRSAMAAVGSALMCGGASMLAGGAVASEGLEGELTEKLADALAEFGAAHLHCLPTNESRLAFLQQVCLLYARNYGVQGCMAHGPWNFGISRTWHHHRGSCKSSTLVMTGVHLSSQNAILLTQELRQACTYMR